MAPRPLYQAREGFLAAGCAAGRLHLNEDLIFFEGLHFQDDPTRFVPVITDFTRQSQRYWRCRVDDVLRLDPRPCSCGSQCTSVEVEGRLQDVLLRRDGSPVFPFELAAVVEAELEPGREIVLTQLDRETFRLACEGVAPDGLRQALRELLAVPGRPLPEIGPGAWVAPAPAEKRRRFRRAFDLESTLLSERLGPPRRLSRGTSRGDGT